MFPINLKASLLWTHYRLVTYHFKNWKQHKGYLHPNPPPPPPKFLSLTFCKTLLLIQEKKLEKLHKILHKDQLIVIWYLKLQGNIHFHGEFQPSNYSVIPKILKVSKCLGKLRQWSYYNQNISGTEQTSQNTSYKE